MNGCVIEGTPIAVDFWTPTKAPHVRLFFLSHLHADHTSGLTRSWRLPIYTSPVNATLLYHKFKLSSELVRELEVGESYLIPLDDDGSYTITVTPLEANHVPGAIMFLFQGYFGNILYCGDMRWYPDLLNHPILSEVVENQELDTVYLDNTFSAPYCIFPPRHQAKQDLFSLIDSYPSHFIKLSIRDLGRESLLEAVGSRFQERILVTNTKYQMLQLLRCSDTFTTDPNKSRIHAVPMNKMTVAAHREWNKEHPTISIILTALYMGWENGPYSSQADNGMFVIPYSDHSSYLELMEMVSQLAPRQILPIVKQWSKSGWWADPSAPDQTIKGDMSVYDQFLTLPPPDPVMMPQVLMAMIRRGPAGLLTHKPRRCMLRRGLSPRRSRVRGVHYCTPDSLSSPSSQNVNSPCVSPNAFGLSPPHSHLEHCLRSPSHTSQSNQMDHSELLSHNVDTSQIHHSTPQKNVIQSPSHNVPSSLVHNSTQVGVVPYQSPTETYEFVKSPLQSFQSSQAHHQRTMENVVRSPWQNSQGSQTVDSPLSPIIPPASPGYCQSSPSPQMTAQLQSPHRSPGSQIYYTDTDVSLPSPSHNLQDGHSHCPLSNISNTECSQSLFQDKLSCHSMGKTSQLAESPSQVSKDNHIHCLASDIGHSSQSASLSSQDGISFQSTGKRYMQTSNSPSKRPKYTHMYDVVSVSSPLSSERSHDISSTQRRDSQRSVHPTTLRTPTGTLLQVSQKDHNTHTIGTSSHIGVPLSDGLKRLAAAASNSPHINVSSTKHSRPDETSPSHIADDSTQHSQQPLEKSHTASGGKAKVVLHSTPCQSSSKVKAMQLDPCQISPGVKTRQLELLSQTSTLIESKYKQFTTMRTIDRNVLLDMISTTKEICSAVEDVLSAL